MAAIEPRIMVATIAVSLRDWFAGQALAAWIAHQCAHQDVYGTSQNVIAEWCYETADAMLEAREKSRDA